MLYNYLFPTENKICVSGDCQNGYGIALYFKPERNAVSSHSGDILNYISLFIEEYIEKYLELFIKLPIKEIYEGEFNNGIFHGNGDLYEIYYRKNLDDIEYISSIRKREIKQNRWTKIWEDFNIKESKKLLNKYRIDNFGNRKITTNTKNFKYKEKRFKEAYVRIDNSNYKNFSISLLYNEADTNYYSKTIYKINQLDIKYEETPFRFVSVPTGNNVTIKLSKDGKIFESYNANLNESKNYIINPLSISIYKIDTAQYGGFINTNFKSSILSGSIIQVDYIDYWFKAFPDSISTNNNSSIYEEKRTKISKAN